MLKSRQPLFSTPSSDTPRRNHQFAHKLPSWSSTYCFVLVFHNAGNNNQVKTWASVAKQAPLAKKAQNIFLEARSEQNSMRQHVPAVVAHSFCFSFISCRAAVLQQRSITKAAIVARHTQNERYCSDLCNANPDQEAKAFRERSEIIGPTDDTLQ